MLGKLLSLFNRTMVKNESSVNTTQGSVMKPRFIPFYWYNAKLDVTQGSVVTPKRANDYPFLIGYYKKNCLLMRHRGQLLNKKKAHICFKLKLKLDETLTLIY